MADSATEIAARVLCSLFKDRGNKETGQSSLSTPSLSPALPTPPLSDDQVHVTASQPPLQTKILQCLEPAIPPPQCHLPVRLVLDHPSLTPGAKSTHSQLLLLNREGNSRPNRPVLHVRGLFRSNKLPPLPGPDPNPDRQLSYHADGTWEEGAAALSLLLANLPNLRNYEGEMLKMRDSLGEKMFEFCRLMEHKDRGLPRELVEKKMMYYLEFIFRLARDGDEQKTILEQERAKMELALSWVSGLIRHWGEHVSTVPFRRCNGAESSSSPATPGGKLEIVAEVWCTQQLRTLSHILSISSSREFLLRKRSIQAISLHYNISCILNISSKVSFLDRYHNK